MGVAPEAPEAGGAAVLVVIGLAAFVAWQTTRGLGYAWNHTVGALLVKIGDALPHVHVFSLHVDLGAPFIDLAETVASALQHYAARSERLCGTCFHDAAWLLREMVKQTEGLAADVLHFGGWVAHVFVPAYVAGWTHLLRTASHATTVTVRQVETRVVRITRVVRVEAHATATTAVHDAVTPLERAVARHRKAIGALTAALGGTLAFPGTLGKELAGIRHLIGWTRRNLSLHNRRLRRLEALFGAAGMAALMANALGLPNWRCITRGNLGRLSRAVCGLPTQMLNDLLGLLLDFAVLADICQVVGWLEQGFGYVSGWLGDFTGKLEAALCHGDYTKPPVLAVPTLSLPAAAQDVWLPDGTKVSYNLPL